MAHVQLYLFRLLKQDDQDALDKAYYQEDGVLAKSLERLGRRHGGRGQFIKIEDL